MCSCWFSIWSDSGRKLLDESSGFGVAPKCWNLEDFPQSKHLVLILKMHVSSQCNAEMLNRCILVMCGRLSERWWLQMSPCDSDL